MKIDCHIRGTSLAAWETVDQTVLELLPGTWRRLMVPPLYSPNPLSIEQMHWQWVRSFELARVAARLLWTGWLEKTTLHWEPHDPWVRLTPEGFRHFQYLVLGRSWMAWSLRHP